MANVIKLKRGSGSDPSASDLVVGEIAIRTDSGKLFTKKDNGTVAEISGSGGSGSNFFINTLSSSSGSGGGSASFNGTATRFTLSNPPNLAVQLLVSINGVIQKPNTGTSPSEGFALDGNDIIFASAPATGASFFIITYASLALAEPSDNTVTSAKIVDGSIVNADINASAGISFTKMSALSANTIVGRRLSNGVPQELTAAQVRTILNVENGATADQTASEILTLLKTVDGSGSGLVSERVTLTNQSGDSSCNILFAQSATGDQLPHTNANLTFNATNGTLTATSLSGVLSNGVTATTQSAGDNSTKVATTAYTDTAISNLVNSAPSALNTLDELAAALNDDASFATTVTNSLASKLNLSGGILTGSIRLQDNLELQIGTGSDLKLFHNGTHSRITNSTGNLEIAGSQIDIVDAALSQYAARFDTDGAVSLYHNGTIKANTRSDGFEIRQHLTMGDSDEIRLGNSSDLKAYHNGTASFITNSTGGLNIEDTGGYLRIKSDDLKLEAENGEDFIACIADGAVQLFHNANQKLATSSSGVSITGNIAVSGTVDGRDVASDGSKLDGIEASATADQTASEILTLIKTVDGAGSGLDADLLDGISSGGFLRSNASDSATQPLTFSGGGGAVTIGGNSDIRLTTGTWTGESAGKIQHHANILYIQGGSQGIQLRGSDAGSMALFQNTLTTFYDDVSFEGGAGAVSLAGGSDIRLANGNWTGDATKIQHHNNSLYIQGGSGSNNNKAIIFRDDGGTDRWFIRDDGLLMPNVDSTYDIGSNTQRVRNIYADTLYGDGSNLTGISTFSGSYNDLTNKPTIPTNNNQLTNGAGYITSASDNTKLPLTGGTISGSLTVQARLDVGNGGGDDEIRIYKGDNNVSDHIQFYNGTTRVGEIGCEDNTWLRINQETNKNIYTPRYIRADQGFHVAGNTVINSSSKILGTSMYTARSTGSNGYVRYRDGTQIVWGNVNLVNTGWTTKSFATAFPNACRSVVTCPNDSTATPSAQRNHQVRSVNKNNFQGHSGQNTNPANHFFIAVGF